MRCFNPYSWLVVWPWPVRHVALGVMLDGRENRVVQYMSYWVIAGCHGQTTNQEYGLKRRIEHSIRLYIIDIVRR